MATRAESEDGFVEFLVENEEVNCSFNIQSDPVNEQNERAPHISETGERDEDFGFGDLNLNDVESLFGLEAIDRALGNVYPHSKPASIFSPATKFWEAGEFPLDYIKVYKNVGNKEKSIKPHWHYVTYGLSDLHGDGRVHNFTGRGFLSGMGFELTFRMTEGTLLGDDPPYWPARLLDNLARYVFNTGIELREYDHIPWHESLDHAVKGGRCNLSKNTVSSSSLIRHMLIVEDPEILNLDSPHGMVQFLQVVGIQETEFKYARSWKACAIIDPLLDHPQVGPTLITDMSRYTSVFDINPSLVVELHNKMEEEGSYLSRVTAHFMWTDTTKEKPTLKGSKTSPSSQPVPGAVTSVVLQFEPGAAELLPLMVQGRLKHGMPFTFHGTKCISNPNSNSQTLHFVPQPKPETLAHRKMQKWPLVKREDCLSVIVSDTLVCEMDKHFQILANIKEEEHLLPYTVTFEDPSITVKIMHKLDLIGDLLESEEESNAENKDSDSE